MTYILIAVASVIAGWLARGFLNKHVINTPNQSNRQATGQIGQQIAQTQEQTVDGRISVNTRKQKETEKIPLTVEGLNEAELDKSYNLYLAYNDTEKLCMSVGYFEAQSIALEIENMKPNRPLTFDVLQTLMLAGHFTVKEIVIDALIDRIFYATVVLQGREGEIDLDTRPSDAVVIALKNNAPVYTYKSVLQMYQNR
jgi:bifunctional DNase/RNase